MRVLVTGGAGYIGSHTAKVLAQKGLEPIVFDNLTTGHREAVRWGPLVEGDLADEDLIRRVLCEHGVEAVIHFAASAYVGVSMHQPREYFQNNVVNTLNLLAAMIDTGVSSIVFSSTCATYGVPTALPISEDHPQHPVNPYGESKLFIERVLGWYSRAYEKRSVALRYFNAAGADPEGDIGEVHTPETHLIPLVMEAAHGQRSHVEIFGTDYPTADGTAIRDYIHVRDLADAHVRAMDYLRDGGESLALNLGTGCGHSVRDVIATVESVSNRSVPVWERERREGDPPALIADASRANEILGWQSQYSSLEQIIQNAWRWHISPQRPY